MIGVKLRIPLPMACHCFGGEVSLFGDQHGHGPKGAFLVACRSLPRAVRISERRIGEGDDEITLSTMRDYPLSLFCPAQAGFFSG
jgi:hypothetical protein